MIWIILGVVVGLIVLGIAAICIRHNIIESRKERNVRANGRTVLASLMMANQTAFDPDGDPEFPGVVVFGYYEPGQQLATRLRAIAEKLFGLYTADPQQLASFPPSLQHVAMTLKDHNYKDSRRNWVPPEIAGDMMVYFGDLWIRRERMPNNWQASRQLACMATGDIEGQVILLPPDDPAAQQLYSSIDPARASADSGEPLVRQAGAPPLAKQNAAAPSQPLHDSPGTSPYGPTSKSSNKFVLVAAVVGGGACLLVIGIVAMAMLLGKKDAKPDAPNDKHQVSARGPAAKSNRPDVEEKEPNVIEPKPRRSDKAEPENDPPTPEQIPVADERFQAIDLQPSANASQTQSTGIAPGMHEFAGIEFQVGTQLLQLGSTVFKKYPSEIRDIRVNGTVKNLHFLQATQGGAYQQPGHSKHEQDGTLVGRYEVHYQNGTTETIPLVYGKHLRGWWNWDHGQPTADAKMAWTGENAQAKRYNLVIRLYLFSWVNPYPDQAIESIDFVSAGAKAAPFCVAMTVERSR